MGKITSVQEYIQRHPKWASELELIASILSHTELEATIKWNAPVYTLNGKNVLGIGAFKNHYGIWFFNGVLLSDPNQVLINAQEGKTKALRQLKFKSGDVMNKALIRSYIAEAIENEKLGKVVPTKSPESTAIGIPEPLKTVLMKNEDLKSSYEALSPYKQKEYCEFVGSAKREATKLTRLTKIIPMIGAGIGLNDKYRK